jgi:hypothetical protein
MSSGSQRERPNGLLRQGSKVVGSVAMPELSEVFIKEFNHCYGQLRLEVIDEQPGLENQQNQHTFKLPMWFRHVWSHRSSE